jgi:hypothetical protein
MLCWCETCWRCGRVNVVLPAWCVPGRSDDAETIGVALLAANRGHGHRRIAARLHRPATTVRGWLRAVRGQAQALRGRAHVREYQLETDPQFRPLPAGTPLGDALTALAAAAFAARRFIGVDRYKTTVWEYIVLISGDRLLRPRRHASG